MRALAVILLVVQVSCAAFQRKLEIPDTEEPIVMVLSNRLAGPLRRMARHAYIAVRVNPTDDWTIWECCRPGSRTKDSPFRPSFGDEVRLHGVITGPRAAAAAACLEPATEEYGNPQYLPWPGPNSNTYVEKMLRECDIPASLSATAIGKDYRGLIGVGVTSEGTGLQLETPVLGLKVGLKEGVEVHIFGLSLGVDLWPPAIIVPVGEGRIGFGDR